MVKILKYINICSLLLISSCALNPSLDNSESIQIITTNDIHGMLGDQDAVFMNPNFPPKIIGAAGYQKYVEDLRESMNSKDILIFDAGCGTGLVGIELKKYGFKNFHGADLSQTLLDSVPNNLYQKLIKVDLNKPIEVEDVLRLTRTQITYSFTLRWQY